MFPDYRKEHIPEPDMFRAQAAEECHVAFDGPFGQYVTFNPVEAQSLERLHVFMKNFRKDLEPLYKDRAKNPEACQKALLEAAREFLQRPCILPLCLDGFSASVDVDFVLEALKTLPPVGQQALRPTNLFTATHSAEQQEAFAIDLLQRVLDDEGAYKKALRTREQRCGRRFETVRGLVANRLQYRRYIGCGRIELSWRMDAPDKHDPHLVVQAKNRLMKDWKRKLAFKGSLDFFQFIVRHPYKGVVVHLYVLFDPMLVPNLDAFTDGIGAAWTDTTQGQGIYHCTHRLGMANPMKALGVGVIDVGNPSQVLQFWEGVRYMCDREMYQRLAQEHLETFSSGSVKDDHWERGVEAELDGKAMPAWNSSGIGSLNQSWGAIAPLPIGLMQGSPDADAIRYYLGIDFQAAQSVYHRPGELASGHLLVVGPTGCGKTRFAFRNALQAHEKGIPTFVVDPHNQALKALPLPTAMLSNGTVGAMGINFLKLRLKEIAAIGIDGQIVEKVELLNQCTGNSLGHREKDILQEALKQIYDEAGLVGEDPIPGARFPNCHDLINQLEAYLEQEERRGLRKSIQGCLSAVRASFGNAVFNQPHAFEIENYMETGARLDVSQTSGKEQGIVVEAFLQQLWDYAKALGPLPVPPANDRERIRMVVVIDEAHILNAVANRDAAGRLLNIIVREGRKFGICLVLLSQSIDDFSAIVKKNIPAWLVFRLSDDSEARTVARKFRVKEEALLSIRNAEQAFFWDGQAGIARLVELAVGANEEERSSI